MLYVKKKKGKIILFKDYIASSSRHKSISVSDYFLNEDESEEDNEIEEDD
jgi:hypothetical protein